MGKSVLSRTPGSTGARTLTPRMWAVVAATVTVLAGAIALAIVLTVGPTAPDAAAPPGGGVPTSGPLPGATPVSGSEVQVPEAGLPTQAPQRLPARQDNAPRVQAPLPPSADAEGTLVPGFPSDLGGPVDGSTVIDSSVASSGDALQFSLRARSDASAADLRAALAARWSAAGLAGAVDDAAVLSFADPYSSVSVAVETTGTGSVYTVYGVLKTA